MTYARLARKYGKHREYFATVKYKNPERFNFLFGFNTNNELSLELAEKFINTLVEDIMVHFNDYSEDKNYNTDLINILRDIGYMEGWQNSQIAYEFSMVLFSPKETFLDYQYKVIKQYIEIRQRINNDKN